ncbi:hypothetical protein ACA910_004951 [Epithemia clementina (nom. ined.)]
MTITATAPVIKTAREAYLHHIQTKSHPSSAAAAASPWIMGFQQQSSSSLLSGGGAVSTAASSTISSSSSSKGSIPVWKQRQLRNREQQQQQQQLQHKSRTSSPFVIPPPTAPTPPPPPPPPSSSSPLLQQQEQHHQFFEGSPKRHSLLTNTASKKGTTAGGKHVLGTVVTPESPFNTPASSKQKLFVAPFSNGSAEDDSLGSSSYENNIYNNNNNSSSQQRQPRFGFFQATTPKVLLQRSLSEKIKTAFPLQKAPSSKDPSDDTHTTLLSSNASLDDDEDRTPTATPVSHYRSTSHGWPEPAQQQQAQQSSPLSVSYPIPNKMGGLPSKATTTAAASFSPKSYDSRPQERQEENGEEDAERERGFVATSSKASVTAKWQELIRQKQDKYSSRQGCGNHGAAAAAAVPSTRIQAKIAGSRRDSSPTARTKPPSSCNKNGFHKFSDLEEEEAAATPPRAVSVSSSSDNDDCDQDDDEEEEEEDDENDQPEQGMEENEDTTDRYIISPASPAREGIPASEFETQQPQDESTPPRQHQQQQLQRSPPRFMVPFYVKDEEEKKDSEQEDQDEAVVMIRPRVQEDQDQDKTEFDQVVNTLAVSVGADVDELNAAGVVPRRLLFTADDAFLFEMIRDCEERWKDSAKLHRQVAHSPFLAYLTFAPNETEQTKLVHLQQAEIAELRSELTAHVIEDKKKQAMARAALEPPDTPSSSPLQGSSSNMSPVEFIDSVPIEHIEVAVMDDQDVCSVTSGLTNLNDLTRGIGEEALSFGTFSSDPFGHEPRAPADKVVTKIIRRARVELHAADGSNRKALYTGPVVGGQFTGFGYFEFEGTGDVYKGEVKNGKMDGLGTYTYAPRSKKNRKRQPKVLRGTFENNVFIG